MATERKLVWAPQKGPQEALVECPCPEVFFGGSRGGGKTDGVLGSWALKEHRYKAHFNAMMFRRTTVSAEDAIERSRQIYRPLGGKFNESKLLWKMPNGGKIGFGYLDSVQDAEEWQGRNLTDVWVEEAGQYPDSKPIDRLQAVLRSAVGVPTQLVITANPGGAGQHWLKERYRLYPFPRCPFVIQRELPNGKTFPVAVIPSRIQDNKILLNADPGYIDRLYQVGSKELVKAWLEGDWSAIEGAFFDCWSEVKHVVPDFVVPDDWLRFRAMDWGSASPFSVGWWAVVGDDYRLGKKDYRLLPRGALVRYREWYGAGHKLTAELVAEGIRKREGPREKISYGVLDPSAFACDGGPSIAERMGRCGVQFRPADNKRVSQRGAMGGWDQLRARLHGDDQSRPMIYCFNHCKDSIRTIPVLQHDPDKPEDLDTDSEDHCFAAGTLVDTNIGTIPIERLDPSKHKVWSAGAWRENYTARKTRENAELIRLVFASGKEVVCTQDHKLLDCSGEWRYAIDLQNVEVACDQSLSVLQFRPSREFGTTSADAISSIEERASIALSGPRITDPFHPARTYTIRMATYPITPSTIWSVLRSKITWAIDMARQAVSAASIAFILPGMRRESGTLPLKVGGGTQNILRDTFALSWISAFHPSAKSAGRNIWSARREQSRESIATLTVAPELCVGVESAGRGPVYCIDEPETHAFTVEGGLIVHNCADEWRYACMSRPYVKAHTPREKPKRDRWDRDEDLPERIDWMTV